RRSEQIWRRGLLLPDVLGGGRDGRHVCAREERGPGGEPQSSHLLLRAAAMRQEWLSGRLVDSFGDRVYTGMGDKQELEFDHHGPDDGHCYALDGLGD